MIAGLSGQQTGELRAMLNTCYANLIPRRPQPRQGARGRREPAAARDAVRALATGKSPRRPVAPCTERTGRD